MIINPKQKKKQSNRILSSFLVLLYAVAVILIFLFINEPLHKFSKHVIINLQNSKSPSALIRQILNILAIPSRTEFLLLVNLIIYNFCNIYKTMVFTLSIQISSLTYGILSMAIKSPRPYWEADVIDPYVDCRYGWNNPSLSSLSAVSCYLALWEILFKNSKIRDRQTLKFSVLFFILLYILIASLVNIYSGQETLEQTLLGVLLGLAIYCLLFPVMRVELNNGEDFYRFVFTVKLVYIIVFDLLVMVLGILVYFLTIGDRESDTAVFYNDQILQKCDHIVITTENIHAQGLYNIGIFLTNSLCFVACHCEYTFTMQGNKDNLLMFNFENDDSIPENEQSLITKISISNKNQWNHTKFLKSLIRLFISGIISAGILIPTMALPINQNIWINLFFKFIIPIGVNYFFWFYLNKLIFDRLRVVNSNVFRVISE